MGDKIAIYPGSFDPITMGHMDLINRGLAVFDKVIVAVANNSSKNALFSLEERVKLISDAVNSPRVSVDFFDGLMVDYLKINSYKTIIRGLRAISDFDYEFQIANMNVHLYPEMDTVFLMTSQKYFYISSSVVKEVASYRGDVSTFVPANVNDALINRFK